MGNVSTYEYAKFRCATLRIKKAIGVTSYGALGHVPPRLSTVYFSGHLRAAQTDIRLRVVAYPVKLLS